MKQIPASKAYDLWSTDYDSQTDNLVIALDENLFTRISERISFSEKVILDIGCGTGRHWKNILAREPNKLIGYDVSEGMLSELKRKFPESETHLLKDNHLFATKGASCDMIISTLTIGYISGIESAFAEWDRTLKPGGDIIITDFHPQALKSGGKRTFSLNKLPVEIKNYVYSIEQIEEIANRNGWYMCTREEMAIDDSVKGYFERKQAMQAFERNKGMLLIYALHFKKTNAII